MKKILVVDDEEKIRSIIRKYGEFEGYEVSEACDGMDAIQKVKENRLKNMNSSTALITAVRNRRN